VLLDDGKPGLALDALTRVEDRIRRIDAPWLELELHRLAGLALLARDDAGGGVERLEQAVDVLEQRRGNIPPDEFMAAFLASKAAVYEETVHALVDARRPGDAFEYCGRAKSRALVDMLSARDDQHLRSANRLDDVRLERLRDELNALYARLHGVGTEASGRSERQVVELTQSVASKEAVYTRLLREARSRDPEFASLNAVDSLGLDRVQDLLDGRTTLLEYFVTPHRLYVFAVRRDGFATEVVEISSRELDQLAQKFRFHLAPFHMGAGLSSRRVALHLAATRANLERLHRALIAPVRRHLTTQRIIVVPHGTLHGVPFHALADGDGWLCERFDISYVPSAAVYAFCRDREDRADGPPTVLAVPDEAAPLIEEEARSVASTLANGTVCVVGDGVTPARVREAAAESRVLHIATHAMFRHDHPMLSCIRLAGGDWLNLYDVYDLEIGAELVVLSACETGVARVTQGDEVMGLMRGFLYAGAPRLLTSQWRVADAATAAFMEVFYGARRDGKSYGAALRTAMSAVRREHPHPYHWAPFFLVGDPDASGSPTGKGRGGNGRARTPPRAVGGLDQ
jgi:CHAT domain-containing protein